MKLIDSAGTNASNLELYIINIFLFGIFAFLSLIIYFGKIFYLLDPSKILLELLNKLESLPYLYSYAFSWNQIGKTDNKRLKEFLIRTYNIDWVNDAKIVKSKGGKIITMSINDRTLSLALDDNDSKVNLKIGNDKSYELKAKKENGELNIYIPSIEPGSESDPVQPIVDVIIKTLLENEEKIALDGISGLERELLKLIMSKNLKGSADSDLASIASHHFTKLGIMAINKNQLNFAEHLISILKSLAYNSLKNHSRWDIPTQFIISLETIGNEAIEHGLHRLAYNILTSIGSIGVEASEKDFRKGAQQAVISLKKLTISAISRKMDDAYISSICLGKIGVKAVDRLWEGVLRESLISLNDIGLEAAKNHNFGTSNEAILNLNTIKNKINNSKFKEMAKLIDQILESIHSEIDLNKK